MTVVLVSSAPAWAQPSDQQLLFDDFESGTLANWQATVGGAGTASVQAGMGTGGSRGARLTVPSYGTSSIAYLRHTLASPRYGISASGRFRALSAGCANGNLPFLRLFDGDGRRVAGVYRINADCATTAKLYVQHSGQFFWTGRNVALDQDTQVELRISVSEPGQSLVQVYVNGLLDYQSTTADNAIKPIASVTIHNEYADQVGDLVADDVRIARFYDPCDRAAAAPDTTDPGTTLLADTFERLGFPAWSTVTGLGDASVSLQTQQVRSGRCAGLISVTANAGSKGNLVKALPAGTGELWADGWFNILRPGASTTSNVPLMRVFTGGARLLDVYRRNGGGALYLRTANGNGDLTSTRLGRVLTPGTWYELKLHVVAAEDGSLVEVWLDGQQLRSVIVPLGTSVLEEAMIGSEHFAQDGDLAVDDVVLKRVP